MLFNLWSLHRVSDHSTSLTSRGHCWANSPDLVCLFIPGREAISQRLTEFPSPCDLWNIFSEAFSGEPQLYDWMVGQQRVMHKVLCTLHVLDVYFSYRSSAAAKMLLLFSGPPLPLLAPTPHHHQECSHSKLLAMKGTHVGSLPSLPVCVYWLHAKGFIPSYRSTLINVLGWIKHSPPICYHTFIIQKWSIHIFKTCTDLRCTKIIYLRIINILYRAKRESNILQLSQVQEVRGNLPMRQLFWW